MAIEFKGSWLLVNGAEAPAGQVTNFTTKDKYIRHDSNNINTTGYTQFEDKTSLKMYIAGYSYSVYYITKIKYYTSSPLSSFSISSQCSTNNTSSSGKKRGAVLSTNENLITSSNYSSFQNRTDIKSFYFSSSKSTITWNETIPAGDFYVYIGPSSTDTSNSSYSTIYAVQASDSVKLTHSGVDAQTYTVTYYANGGTGAPASQTKTQGVNLTLSSTKPTKSPTKSTVTGSFKITGNANGGYFGSSSTTTTSITASTSRQNTTTYTFSKWNTNKDGSGTPYESGATYTKDASLDLYAQYTTSTSSGSTQYSNNEIKSLSTPTRDPSYPITYMVYFEANGGNCAVTAIGAQTTRTYTFGGWATSENATSANASEKYEKAVTLYAYWPYEDKKASITLPTPTRVGYNFVGWATTQNATSADVGTGSYTPQTTIRLYAVWKANGNIRIHINSTDKYKMALVYMYAPTSTNDTKPWKLLIPYMYKSGTQPWKIIAG